MSPTDESLEIAQQPEATAPKDSGAVTRGWIVPAIIGSALLMQTLNATSINNALPAMARALHVEPLRLNVAITMYLQPLAGVLVARPGEPEDRIEGLKWHIVAKTAGKGDLKLDEALAQASAEDRAKAEAAARKWLGAK